MKCNHCSADIETNLTNLMPGLCHTCTFWTEKTVFLSTPHVARIDGKHYSIGPENVGPFMRGMGGREFIIKFDDGRTVTTTNLWSQGSIPDNFKALLPDNAVFVPSH